MRHRILWLLRVLAISASLVAAAGAAAVTVVVVWPGERPADPGLALVREAPLGDATWRRDGVRAEHVLTFTEPGKSGRADREGPADPAPLPGETSPPGKVALASLATGGDVLATASGLAHGFDHARLARPGPDGAPVYPGGLDERAFRALERRCLAIAIYFSAAEANLEGARAIAQTIINRTRHGEFAPTICGVVHQTAGEPGTCQYAFACDGLPDEPRSGGSWELAGEIAEAAMSGRSWNAAIGDATHYHAVGQRPRWTRLFERVGRLGPHVFYRSTHLGGRPGPGRE